MSDKPTHSTRFTRAARAESERLLRRQRRGAEQVQKIEEQLEAARAELEQINRQLEVLRGITDEPPALRPAPAGVDAAQLLRGAAIRRRAVELLQEQKYVGAIHYRRWLDLLEASGYRVDGKRPDAVFLGQIVRSPVVKATTSAGFYELDEDAPRRLTEEITSLEEQMTKIGIEASGNPERVEEGLERRHGLTAQLRRVERELKEALLALGRSESRLAA
jgi:hypothetical protein